MKDRGLLRLLLVLVLALNGALPAQAMLRHVQAAVPAEHCHGAGHDAAQSVVTDPAPAQHGADCCQGGTCHCPAAIAVPRTSAMPSAVSTAASRNALPPLLTYTSRHPSFVLRPPIA